MWRTSMSATSRLLLGGPRATASDPGATQEPPQCRPKDPFEGCTPSDFIPAGDTLARQVPFSFNWWALGRQERPRSHPGAGQEPPEGSF